MYVAVSGASGHIGANLVRALLERGDKVRAFVRSDTAALEGLDVEQVQVEITDRDSVMRGVEGVDVMFHLAAFVSIAGERDREELEAINVEGPRNVVEACLEHKVKRLVHFSSIHAIEGQHSHRKDADPPVVDEDSGFATAESLPWYDRTKSAGEQLVLDAIERGLDAVVINPTSVVGPNDFKPSPQGAMLMTMYKRRFLPMVTASYNWVDVRDVVAGALAALEKGNTGERYLLGNEHLSFKQISNHVADAIGRGRARLCVPLWVSAAGLPFAALYSKITGRQQLLTSESLEILTRHQRVSIDKAQRELGYAPRPFAETIKDTLTWYVKNGKLKPKGNIR
jgi:dihydroflavonol-4-reductase